MSDSKKDTRYSSTREKFLGLSLESTRKSYYPQLQQQLEAAKENERRLQLLIDSLPARISYVDKEQRYVTVNLEYEQVFHIPCQQIIGQTVAAMHGEENYSRLKDYILKVLSGEPVQFECELTFSGVQAQWYGFNYVPVFSGVGEEVDGFYVLARDLTEEKRVEDERKKLEEKLRVAQRLNALGTLAGGVAHDFNNLLMGIQGRASLMSVNMDASHPLLEHVTAIEEYIRSAANLTKQLLGFARGGKYEVKATDLNELLEKSSKMFSRTKKELRVHQMFCNSSLVAEVDRRQIDQVLLNIYLNAWQAMPEGGDLYIVTKQTIIDETLQNFYEIPSGKYAKISITDTGIGMTEDVRLRVFDPFFTTKEKQRGTGLGLASAHGIIKNHNGLLTVYSEPGEGTTFNIYLPLSNQAVLDEEPVVETLQRGVETILLVDDEEIIREVGKTMLETLGYNVMVEESGERAVATIRSMGAAINLVLLDLIMPGIDGGQAFDKIRQLQPDIAVILSSGYSINGQADDIMKRGCNGFIQKPFNLTELSIQIRKVLDKKDQPPPDNT